MAANGDLDLARAQRSYIHDNMPRFNDSPKNRLPRGDFGIRHGA